ncbi:MAG TPA: ATP synthase F0 subunit B [Firmicutes bacterium]|nr:ATP synthase F0 subunit B [Bacillota bacterium]
MNVNWTLIFQAISFLILLFLLKKMVYQRVLETLDKRKADIAGDIEAARNMREEAQKIKSDYQSLMDQARSRGEEMRKEIIEAAQKEKESIIKTAEKEGDRLRQKAEKDLALQIKKAQEELRNEVAGLSVGLASKILEAEIDRKKHDDLVERFLSKVGDVIES